MSASGILRVASLLVGGAVLFGWFGALSLCAAQNALRVGAAAVEVAADDSMPIAGGIIAGKVQGQEGKLRAVAVVLEQGGVKLAIAACDVLMLKRQHLDPAMAEIESSTGIPQAHILINCTHTHHAPSTMQVHDYDLDETFTRRVQRGLVQAVQQANANLSKDDCRFFFHLGQETTVGQNSRQRLADGQIYWVGPRHEFVRPTGPFDPELPVLGFRDSQDRWRALIFNHSTHTIGTRHSRVRSPSFYGLAAQELETSLGGTVCFLEGASGSTHNLTLSGEEMTRRIKHAVLDAINQSQPRAVPRLAALKRPFKFKVRHFDEAAEDAAVTRYCRKYVSATDDTVIRVFRKMRQALASQQGQERETWLQVLLIGDVAIAGVPAEYFTQLGLDIKNRSPFRYTFVAELANDWIGYLPDLTGHKLGGYQVWTGYHSYAEPGTGERIVDEVTAMLRELAASKPSDSPAASPQSGATGSPAAAPGPLRVSSRNPRYFSNASGKAIYLTGSHTWNSLQELATADTSAKFDFTAYLDFLQRHQHNFIRLWRWELTRWDTAANQEAQGRVFFAAPHPWPRTGPGVALDGKPKFDLSRFDPEFFERVRSRVSAAAARGIYTSVMLFEGWGLRFVQGGWEAHPFHPDNNINGMERKLAPNQKGIALFSLASPAVTALQEAYVNKVIETVNDLDHVLYEISNESDFTTTEWQYHFIRHIKKVEAGKPKQHPVGMTSIGYGVDDLDRLLQSPADWISPNPDRFDYKSNPPAASGDKVILIDTDHLWGVGGDVDWVWKSFLRGLNPIFMDTYQRDILDRGAEADWEAVRRTMGYARRLAERMNLVDMTPHSDFASSGWCLANPGKEYLVYLPDGRGTVDLSAASGRFDVEWLSPANGHTVRADSVAGGTKHALVAPFEGEGVVSLRVP